MGYKIKTKLDGTNVLSLADAKKFLRIDHATSDEDTVITAYINAAVSYCENYCSKLFHQRIVIFLLSDFKEFIFPYSDVVVTSVKTRENKSANHDNTLTESTQWSTIPGTPSILKFTNSLPTPDPDDLYPISVLTTVGNYQIIDGLTYDHAPESVIQAVRMLVGHYYEQRNAVVVGSVVSTVPMGVHALLNPERFIHIES